MKQEYESDCWHCFLSSMSSFFCKFIIVFLIFPQLEGVNEPVVLQVFVANDAGRVKPHGFYQACRVTGRNTTACKEVDIDGTTVIEVSLDSSTNMTLAYVNFLAFVILVWSVVLKLCSVIICLQGGLRWHLKAP